MATFKQVLVGSAAQDQLNQFAANIIKTTS